MSKSQVSSPSFVGTLGGFNLVLYSSSLDSDSDMICRDCSSWTGQQPLMIGFTELAQSRTGARGE